MTSASLLGLPPEVRLIIFEYVYRIYYYYDHLSYSSTTHAKGLKLPKFKFRSELLLVCRQFQAECTRLMRRYCVLRVGHERHGDLLPSVRAISLHPDLESHIQSVSFKVDSTEYDGIPRRLQKISSPIIGQNAKHVSLVVMSKEASIRASRSSEGPSVFFDGNSNIARSVSSLIGTFRDLRNIFVIFHFDSKANALAKRFPEKDSLVKILRQKIYDSLLHSYTSGFIHGLSWGEARLPYRCSFDNQFQPGLYPNVLGVPCSYNRSSFVNENAKLAIHPDYFELMYQEGPCTKHLKHADQKWSATSPEDRQRHIRVWFGAPDEARNYIMTRV